MRPGQVSGQRVIWRIRFYTCRGLLKSRFRMVKTWSFKQSFVSYGRCLFMTHIHRQALARDRFTIHVHRKVFEIEMMEPVRVLIQLPKTSLFLAWWKRCFGYVPNTALLMESDWDPLENVKVLSSILVTLYLARPPLFRMCGLIENLGLGLMRLTWSLVSRNLKVAFESPCVFIKKKLDLMFVKFICRLTPWNKNCGTLQISRRIRPITSISFLCFCRFHGATKPLFFASALVESQVAKSSSSRYQNAVVRCEMAASIP